MMMLLKIVACGFFHKGYTDLPLGLRSAARVASTCFVIFPSSYPILLYLSRLSRGSLRTETICTTKNLCSLGVRYPSVLGRSLALVVVFLPSLGAPICPWSSLVIPSFPDRSSFLHHTTRSFLFGVFTYEAKYRHAVCFVTVR